ncbi:alpha/beta hydrolase [Cryobacterium sp. PH29-G1]|uniref:alpha/beta hydrolase n=1 Tax=Cryobacterium sp. PH29-G1 TaxID=3046211 RepID=UPI0024B9301F|nr:alpha/beta hydrolase [Cryobacterium sp. PH29-G1]MDJ0349501.1 alpha/beta hydrolase [Cryobacterium sp. PH29-G1]
MNETAPRAPKKNRPRYAAGQPSAPTASPRLAWIVRVVAAAGVLVVAWACLTGWGAIVHGHPLYAVLLVATLLASALVGWRTVRPRPGRTTWRRILRIALVVVSIAWIALMAWLRPFSADEPAVAAMDSDTSVTVAEDATRIVLTPTGVVSTTGVFFQPGAKVDARAYAAVLRPLAESGYTVIIPKQPLSIAFLAITTFDAARSDFPGITRWVVGGHSLGGTVAAIQADAGDSNPVAPVVGLLLYASYPANDISTSLTTPVLSISATNDGLATPEKIEASKQILPAESTFTVIDGAVHAFFGDYGPQPGDGTPAVSHDDARGQISRDTVAFVSKLSE